MAFSDSMTGQSNRPTQIIVFTLLTLAAIFVGVQYRATAPITDATDVQVAPTPETISAEDKPPTIRRVRLSEATMRLQQKAKSVSSVGQRNESVGQQEETVPETTEPVADTAQPQSIRPDSLLDQPSQFQEWNDESTERDEQTVESEAAEPSLDDETDEQLPSDSAINPPTEPQPESGVPTETTEETPGTAEGEGDAEAVGTNDSEDTPSDEPAEQPSDANADGPSLRISYAPADGETVEIFVNEQVHKIQAGGELNLPGDGPWTIQFVRGDQILSRKATIPSGTYLVQPFGQGWQLKPVPEKN